MPEVQVYEGNGAQTFSDVLYEEIKQTENMLQLMEKHGYSSKDWMIETLRENMFEQEKRDPYHRIFSIWSTVRALASDEKIRRRSKPKEEPRQTVEKIEKMWRKIKNERKRGINA